MNPKCSSCSLAPGVDSAGTSTRWPLREGKIARAAGGLAFIHRGKNRGNSGSLATRIRGPFMHAPCTDGRVLETRAEDQVGGLHPSSARDEEQCGAALPCHEAADAARDGRNSAGAAEKAASADLHVPLLSWMAAMVVCERCSWPVSASAGDQRLAQDVPSTGATGAANGDAVRTHAERCTCGL